VVQPPVQLPLSDEEVGYFGGEGGEVALGVTEGGVLAGNALGFGEVEEGVGFEGRGEGV